MNIKIVIASLLLGLAAGPVTAVEPVTDNLVLADKEALPPATLRSPHLATSGMLKLLRQKARANSSARRLHSEDDSSEVTVNSTSSGLIAEAIELECLPLMALSKTDERKIVFGIGFNGVVGLHGKF